MTAAAISWGWIIFVLSMLKSCNIHNRVSWVSLFSFFLSSCFMHFARQIKHVHKYYGGAETVPRTFDMSVATIPGLMHTTCKGEVKEKGEAEGGLGWGGRGGR